LKETIMKSNYVATALVLALGLAASSTFATESGGLSREQVRASVLQAVANGTLRPVNDRGVMTPKAAPSTLTRAAVMADYLATKKVGMQYHVFEQDAAPAVQDASVAPRSRAEVRSEALLATHNRTDEFRG